MKRAIACILIIALAAAVMPTTAGAAVPGKEFTETGCDEYSDSVARLYTAGLGREPEQGGFEFWMAEYTGGRWQLPAMAAYFAQSPEFEASYGALTQDGFIRQLYRNVLGREGEQSGVTFWNQQMALGMDRGTVLLRFAESPENIVNSGTVEPALGPFNTGQPGPWDCVAALLSNLEWLTTYNEDLRDLLDFASSVLDDLEEGMTRSECAIAEVNFENQFGPKGSDFLAKLESASPKLEDAGFRFYEGVIGSIFYCKLGFQVKRPGSDGGSDVAWVLRVRLV